MGIAQHEGYQYYAAAIRAIELGIANVDGLKVLMTDSKSKKYSQSSKAHLKIALSKLRKVV